MSKKKGDHKLACREVLKGKDKFAEWGISEEMLRAKFAGVDSWVPHMTFVELADWIMKYRMEDLHLKLDDSEDEEVQFEAASATLKASVDLSFPELGADSDLNMLKIKEVFAAWDNDNSGGIEFEELASVMKALNPDFTDRKCRLLFEAADTNHDGIITFDEFFVFVFR